MEKEGSTSNQPISEVSMRTPEQSSSDRPNSSRERTNDLRGSRPKNLVDEANSNQMRSLNIRDDSIMRERKSSFESAGGGVSFYNAKSIFISPPVISLNEKCKVLVDVPDATQSVEPTTPKKNAIEAVNRVFKNILNAPKRPPRRN